ncbi:MAG: threonine--tRNA ligase, partial [Myxococcota bacterium]
MITAKISGRDSVQAEEGARVLDILKNLADKPAAVIAASVNGHVCDLTAPVKDGDEIAFITAESPEGLKILRHSTAHVMADAVKRLFPEAKLTIGPAVDDGFYYDFDIAHPFSPEDLAVIESEMAKIVKENRPFVREELSREDAAKLFGEKGESYKLEILSELPEGEKISIYRHGDFVDLCRGPHLQGTGKVRAYKLMSIAGAYWRGDEKNKMLQRLYGTAFPSKDALEQHVQRLEEAKKRDHRRLGKELDLFSTSEEIGGGLVLWHPNGAMIRMLAENFWREQHL